MEESSSQYAAPENESKSRPGNNQYLIVGIGASAGGIRALKEFFQNVPASSGIAYVVILHLSPDHDSQLAAVLQTVAKIPVTQVATRVHVEPDHVYVVSPNLSLRMDDSYIAVTHNTSIEERRAPIDIFFRTLAESHCNYTVGVVLSGTGANGSMGLKRIKEQGGAVFVQNPREAEFSDMSRNAIATDLVDDVLNAFEIPAKIIAYKKSLDEIVSPVQAERNPEETKDALRKIFRQLRLVTGHDFSDYKRSTILRRIERRMNVHELTTLAAYAAYLDQHMSEVHVLLKDLLISVTNFFRDREAFNYLANDVLPLILHGKNNTHQVRVWITGCATGEEAYSIAMLFAERTFSIEDAPEVKIFASDIDEAAIAKAREGFYSLNDAADVSPERLRRFFIQETNGYRVCRELRGMILFSNHNLIKDPPFSRLDLVTCRNLLIYLNPTAQEHVMKTLHFALKPSRYLFLGLSESVDGATDLYTPVSKEFHIFQSRLATTRSAFQVPDIPPQVHSNQPVFPAISSQHQEEHTFKYISYGNLHQQLLEQYAPPSVIVNEEYNIVHLSEHAGQYMQLAGGELSKNILALVHPELRFPLRTTLYQAISKRTNVEAKNLKVRIRDREEVINIQVRPVLSGNDAAHGFILILFEQTTDTGEQPEEAYTLPEPIINQLEEEVKQVRAQLRASSEQYEVQSEELKASNEDLQAINEELRSAAEELETSKEELQSLNEELRTVNQELKVKIEEILQTSNDFQNLVNSTDIGTVFLDRSFRVSLFSPAAREVFNLIPADIGRPLTDITNKLPGIDLGSDAKMVLEKLHTIEREIKGTNGRGFLLRVTPYRTIEDRIDGVVMTFLDITKRMLAEEKQHKSELRYRTLFSSIEEGFCIIEKAQGELLDFRYVEANPSFTVQTGISNVVGKTIRQIVPNESEEWFIIYNTVLETGKPLRFERFLATQKRILDLYAFRLEDRDNFYVAIIFKDITERRHADEKLRISEERLRLMVESATDYAIFSINKDNLIDTWNTGAENVFGYTEEEIIDKSGEILFSSEDCEAGIPAREIATALQKGSAEDERWHIRKDGSRFYASGIMQPLYREGSLQGFVKIARDQTAKLKAESEVRKLEERYRIALESADMATWDWNLTTNKIIWNEKHFLLFGIKPHKTQIKPDYFLEFVNPDDLQMVKTALNNCINVTGIYQAEFRITRADNKAVRWMQGYGRVVERAEEKPVRVIGVMMDITERKALELQKDEFIGIASHELKTPVTSIKAYAQMLRNMFEEVNDSRSGVLMRKLDAQVDRLTSLIRDLLDTTKIFEGQLALHIERFDLGALIIECVEDLQRLSQKHRIIVQTEDMPLITVDRERIRQVLTNLISNAVKYSPNNNDVTITCKAITNAVQVSVHDNGIGIPKELQHKVFDRFFRVTTDSASHKFPGMGLGLYITAGIIERHGGNIWVESKPNEGSTFYFTLPVAES